MNRTFRWLALTAVAVFLGAAPRQSAPPYEVYAIKYASVKDFKVSGLIAGADTSRRLDIAMMVWLMKGADGRIVVMDAGFKREDLIRRWKPVDYVTPAAAIARFGVRPEDVTDLIISHVHWDHLDGADLFPNAKIWIQKDEYEHHIVQTREGTVVLASDNMYLYENLEKHLPIAQTLDAASNVAAQERMMRIASDPRLIVPGHDPKVFERFPLPGHGVARIQ
jgi:glyoxylase-like metal-dependent hydrolase (beta-lactamase superfamily II)